MSRYSEYQAYGSSGFPENWQARRLRFAVKLNPSKHEVLLSDSELVSFVPMDAIGEYGGIRLDENKELGEIGSGYCVFQTKVATDSRRSLPPIPRESCH
jgi:type I restriction enzyme S subunit